MTYKFIIMYIICDIVYMSDFFHSVLDTFLPTIILILGLLLKFTCLKNQFEWSWHF